MSIKSKEDNMRPWGFYEILSDKEDHKVKRITVYPGKRLSLQRHQKRSEHWFIVQGYGVVTLDDQKVTVSNGKAIDIPVTTAHRIENSGQKNLVFIEVQTGSYFGEDDIQRLEDDFGRA
ncbi:MAG: phosphomannose isomerase type II C-terminal cupin domain [Pseudomonadota bacterium]